MGAQSPPAGRPCHRRLRATAVPEGCRHNRSEEPDALARTSGSVRGPSGNRRATATEGLGATGDAKERPCSEHRVGKPLVGLDAGPERSGTAVPEGCRHNRSEEPDALARTSGSVRGPSGNRRATATEGLGATGDAKERPCSEHRVGKPLVGLDAGPERSGTAVPEGCRHNRSEEPDALARTSGSVRGPSGNRRATATRVTPAERRGLEWREVRKGSKA